MGISGLPAGHLPGLPKNYIWDLDVLCCENGVVVYVYFGPGGTVCRSVCFRGRDNRSMDEADGLLYAEGCGLDEEDEYY